MSKPVSKEEQFVLKFNLLKEALIKEKQKNSSLQSEISNLNDDLMIQKQIISRLQGESKQGKISDVPLENLFDEAGNAKELTKTLEEKIQDLTKENEFLKDQIASVKKDKENVNMCLDDMLKQYSQLKESNEIQINDLQTQSEALITSHLEDNKRLESMSLIIKQFEMEKNQLENENELILKTIKGKDEGFEKLFEEQNLMNEEIEKLKAEIIQLKNENKRLSDYIDEISPISIKTVFKGVRILSTKPRTTSSIEMTFGEIDNCLVIRQVKENGKVFKLKFINNMVKIAPNMIRFNIQIEGTKQMVYLIEFETKYIDYILHYYSKGTLKKKFVENLLMTYSFDNYQA